MSADIQGKRTVHKAVLLETRAGKRSSCLPGKAAIYSPPPNPSCQSLQRNGQFIYGTLGQCSRTDGTSDLIWRKVFSWKHTKEHVWSHTGTKEYNKNKPLLSGFLWFTSLLEGTAEKTSNQLQLGVSDERTSRAFLEGRDRYSRGPSESEWWQMIKILHDKHRLVFFFWPGFKINVVVRCTCQTWSKLPDCLDCGKLFQARFCLVINFSLMHEELYFLSHCDG